MAEITFLTQNQVYGKNRLEGFKEIGSKAAITDFAIVTGGYVSSTYLASSDCGSVYKDLEERTGHYWTRTIQDNQVCIVNEAGESDRAGFDFSSCGCRLAIQFGEEWDDFLKSKFLDKGDQKYCCLGYYPNQAEVDQDFFEEKYQEGEVLRSESNYTFAGETYPVYQDGIFSYIHVKVRLFPGCSEVVLSDGETYRNGDFVWIRVQSVQWWILRKEKMLLSKNIVCAGLNFSNRPHCCNFKSSSIKKFLDSSFLSEFSQFGFDDVQRSFFRKGIKSQPSRGKKRPNSEMDEEKKMKSQDDSLPRKELLNVEVPIESVSVLSKQEEGGQVIEEKNLEQDKNHEALKKPMADNHSGEKSKNSHDQIEELKRFKALLQQSMQDQEKRSISKELIREGYLEDQSTFKLVKKK